MSDQMTVIEPTPPTGVPVTPVDEVPLVPCHTGAAAASCGVCWSITDLLNERARRG